MADARRILMLFDNVNKDYIARLSSGATRAVGGSGYTLASENLLESGRKLADCLGDAGVAGVILTPPLSDDRHSLLMIENRKLPLVRIAPMLDPERGGVVMMDEYQAARAVVEVMLERGHRRVAILRGPSTHLVSMRRYNGYAAALGGKGLRVDQALVATGDFTRESGRRMGETLLAARPTAVFASNDDMAAGVIDAASAQGLRVPQDVSVVGYDDVALARTMRPRLTTVRQPLEDMGATAVKMVIEQIASPARRPRTEVIPFEIMERESVADTAVQ